MTDPASKYRRITATYYPDHQVTPRGRIASVLTIVACFAIGFGLMALALTQH